LFSKNCKNSNQSGFTLIEVLLVVTILGVISAMVFEAFAGTMRAIETIKDDQGSGSLIRGTLQFMSNELSAGHQASAVPWVGQNSQQNGQPADTLAFLTTAQERNGVNARETEISRVVYTREGNRLVRFARRNLFGLTDESIEQIELLDGVTGFKLRYYDSITQIWIDQWDGRLRGTLPRAVMIEITVQRPNRQPETFQYWVTIQALAS
jgi:general secretion pathway protein J